MRRDTVATSCLAAVALLLLWVSEAGDAAEASPGEYSALLGRVERLGLQVEVFVARPTGGSVSRSALQRSPVASRGTRVAARAPATVTRTQRIEAVDLAKPDEIMDVTVFGAVACDTSLEPGERIAALIELRVLNLTNVTFPDGLEPLSGQVVRSMIDLALESPDNREIREQIIKNLDNAQHPDLMGALLHFLATDPDDRVREEAAESLAQFAHDQRVRRALSTAASWDASPTVQSQARAALGDTTD